MGPVNNNNFNWERALLKKRCGGNTNTSGGSGKVNIDDIILADDLLEKCRALDFSGGNEVVTDWTFSDICVQDSYGVLQAALEDYEGSGPYAKGFGVYDENISDGTIQIDDEDIIYAIFYNEGKYKVRIESMVQ